MRRLGEDLLSGVLTTTVTPFTAELEVDYEGLRRVIDHVVEGGVNCVIPLGTVGEFASLTNEERRRVAEVVVDQANGRVPVIVGVTHTSLKEAVALARHAKDVGADGLLVVPPTYYFRGDGRAVIEFFSLLAARVELPLVLYNLPGPTGIELSGPLMEELAAIEGVVGVKDATNSMPRLYDTIRRVGDRIAVVAGAEEYSYFGLLLGAIGFTTSFANFAPQIPVALYHAHREGDLEAARQWFLKMLRLRLLVLEPMSLGIPAYIPLVKAVMRRLGLPAGPPRPPLQPLPPEAERQLAHILVDIGLMGRV